MELNENLYNQILELCEDGDTFVDVSNFESAIEKYLSALELLPHPKNVWEASTWIYTALGDTCYLNKQYQEALDYMFETLKCPTGLENPFVLLRIGEIFCELQNIAKAQEYLLQAYMISGFDIFEGEPEKYISLIKNLV